MTQLKWIVSAMILASLWACGSPKQSTVDQFFRAAQTNDHATLSYMSAVGPPGDVESWKVVEVSSRSTEPFALPELLAKLQVAEAERDAAREERKKYFNDQEDALSRIIPKLRKDAEYKFRGKLGAIQEEWLKMLEDRKEKEQVFQELKRAADAETKLVTKSVVRQMDVGKLEGDIEVTKMLMDLKLQDGDTLPYAVTLRKYDLSDPESDRVEPARWVIADIEGTTPEARAAAAKAREPVLATESPKVADNADSKGAEESKHPGRKEPKHRAREQRGVARVQILAPETKVEGSQAITTIRARNVSKGWITLFTVTEHWYDDQGNVVKSSSRTHKRRFMPDDVIELELRTRKSPNFYQNQFEFSHANGEVSTTVVGSFPKQT